MGQHLGKLTALGTSITVLAFSTALWAPLFGCGDSADGDPDGGRNDAGSGFDDHTVPLLASREQYFELAAQGVGHAVTKFVITDFADPSLRNIRFSDSVFYTLHDEWYWFRLLNGERVPGDPNTAPVEGLTFTSIANIYAWAKVQPTLPLDLTWAGDDRLYSPRFYALALPPNGPRAFGVGGILHVAERTQTPLRPELWLLELEYTDNLTHEDLVIFFEAIEPKLPPEIGPAVRWVVRSPSQEQLALRMEREQLRYHDRIIRYSELAVPGEVQVYSAGLTAGRLKIIRAGEGGFESTTPQELLISETIPDFLPQAAGLITSVPQTPLAHINVLARNRGIPNAYLGGVLDDPSLDQLARVQAPAILRAMEPDQLTVKAMTQQEYSTWLSLNQVAPTGVPQIDLLAAPLTLDLTQHTQAEVETLRPLIGGKASGFLGLLSAPGLFLPDKLLAITIKPYKVHLEALLPAIQAMLRTPEFQSRAPARYLALEGPTKYAARFFSASDAAFATAFMSGHPAGDLVGDLVRAGGLVRAIRDQQIPSSVRTELLAAIASHFSGYAVSQGIRFRSSSTVEDLEGFVAAGLYDSNTGYFDPLAQVDPQDQEQTIEWAIKKTWASYWGFEAFEERRTSAIDHLSGNMGVAVHARFTDSEELSNGIFAFTRLPRNAPERGRLLINIQKGIVSVANPDGSALPEQDLVIEAADGSLSLERLRASTLVQLGEVLLDDDQLRELYGSAAFVADRWLAQENSGRLPSQASETLTLEFDIKHVDTGWPAFLDGHLLPRRLVLKQARSLEPGARRVPNRLHSEPFPYHLLSRTRRIERRVCATDRFVLTSTESYTNPLIAPNVGFDVEPFTAAFSIELTRDVPELGRISGQTVRLEHLDLATFAHPQVALGTGWSFTVSVKPSSTQSAGFSDLMIESGGNYRISTGTTAVTGVSAECRRDRLYSTGQDYLQTLLDEPER